MEIKIYQINTKRDERRVCFMDLSFTERHGGIRPEDYDVVFHGEVDVDTLFGVYVAFNVERPADYKARSLSVSDIVEVIKAEKSEFYYCDSFGWELVEFDPSKAIVRI